MTYHVVHEVVELDIVNSITWEVESKYNMGNLENDLIAFHVTESNRLTHPFYKANGSVSEISARLLAAHRRLAHQCHHAQCAERIPSERTCCINLLILISDKTFHEACQILSHDELVC